jgi:vacuolar-type H+-ATPase subunit H
MEILSILEALEELVENAPGVLFSGRCILDRDEVLEIVKEIRLKLPDDLKQAKWVKDERQRILQEAQKEGNDIIKNAESRISSLVDEHEITKKAYEQANDMITNAKQNSREIKLGTKEYADNVLSKVEDILKETLEVIQVNREEMK